MGIQEVRHNGALVMRGGDHEVEAWKKGHPDMEGITVSPGGEFELHADGEKNGSFIDSFATFEEARVAHDRFSTPQGEGEVKQPAQFPKAEVRATTSGEVVHPLAEVPMEVAAETHEPATEPASTPASEAPTDPAPPEG